MLLCGALCAGAVSCSSEDEVLSQVTDPQALVGTWHFEGYQRLAGPVPSSFVSAVVEFDEAGRMSGRTGEIRCVGTYEPSSLGHIIIVYAPELSEHEWSKAEIDFSTNLSHARQYTIVGDKLTFVFGEEDYMVFSRR